MLADDCDSLSNTRQMLTNWIVFIIGFFGTIQSACYQRLCDDERVGLSDCKYVHFGGDKNDRIGVAAVWYTSFYALLMVVGIIGLFNACCSKLRLSKFYAVGLVVIFFCITICDWITLGAVGQVHKGRQNLREFYMFQGLLHWLMQLAIISAAAYDSWNFKIVKGTTGNIAAAYDSWSSKVVEGEPGTIIPV